MNTIAIDTIDSLASERQAFADLAQDISLKKLAKHREEHDKYPFGELFTDAIQDAGEVGFYGVNLSADFGGVGMNTGMVAIVLEKMSETDASLAGIVFTNAAALEILQAGAESAGNTSLYQEIKSLGTLPIAFPAYVSPDEIEMPVADESHKTVSGEISYLVLGNIADYAIVPAWQKDAHKFSYYLIDLKSDKIKKSKPIVSLGLHACPAVDITMINAPAQLIGMPEKGQDYFIKMQHRMSVCSAAISLGILRGSFEDAMQYTAERYQGGRQIIDWPQVRMMLANMAIEMKIGKSCLTMACQEMDCDAPGWEQTAQAAAIHIGELAIRSTTDGVQLFGGYGYTKDYPQEKRMRDSRQVQSLLGMVPLRKVNYIARHIEGNK